MLSQKKKITVESKSIVDDKEIAIFRAIFDEGNADSITFFPTQIDKSACRKNREIVRADQADFEDFAYMLQEKMFSEDKGE